MTTYGADVAGLAITTTLWHAFIDSKDISFAIVRCFRNGGGGEIDGDCLATFNNARAAGLTAIDVYHFPVIHDRTPEEQANMTMDFITDNGLECGVVWLDVEQGDTPWSPTAADNVDFISTWVSTIEDRGGNPGLYCGTDGWNAITNHSIEFANYPLWWSSHGKAFLSFGGWTNPHTTQNKYEQQFKAIAYDANFRIQP